MLDNYLLLHRTLDKYSTIKIKTLVHTLKIRYFLGFDGDQILLLPSDEIFKFEELVKIFAHGFMVGRTNDAVTTNLIFYN